MAWSIVTPPFQVPDEPDHVAYVKLLAEDGRLPSLKEETLSVEEARVLGDLHYLLVAQKPQIQTISTRAQEQALQSDLGRAREPPEEGSEGTGVARSQPPLYYVLETVPYILGESGTLLDRVELMRLLSALMAGLTALFTFLFLREALRGAPWAWTVGGLGVALTPLLGFMSGGVNPDAMLYAVTAALFYGLARAFRRGLTRRLALVLGAMTAVGFATKLNFAGIAPGVLLGLILLSVKSARTMGRAAYVSLALALALALSPVGVYLIVYLASGSPAIGSVMNAAGNGGPLWKELSYIWQLYLPRLPGMHDDFSGIFTTRQLWFNGYIGLYGWLDTTFPAWVYDVALVTAAIIAGLCIRSLLRNAGALRARAGELVVYGIMGLGLMVMIGAASYLDFPAAAGGYAEARYLLPLLPLLGVVYALAARGAGRRWGPAAGAAIVVLCLSHDVASQLQVVARYYG